MTTLNSNSTIVDNTVDRNGEGFFFFSSVDNVITGNHLAGNDIGARIWAGTERNVVRDNAFIGNRQQIFYEVAALFLALNGRLRHAI